MEASNDLIKNEKNKSMEMKNRTNKIHVKQMLLMMVLKNHNCSANDSKTNDKK